MLYSQKFKEALKMFLTKQLCKIYINTRRTKICDYLEGPNASIDARAVSGNLYVFLSILQGL